MNTLVLNLLLRTSSRLTFVWRGKMGYGPEVGGTCYESSSEFTQCSQYDVWQILRRWNRNLASCGQERSSGPVSSSHANFPVDLINQPAFTRAHENVNKCGALQFVLSMKRKPSDRWFLGGRREDIKKHTNTLCGQNAEFVPHRKHITSPLKSPTG
jgi:hypothetical protein